MDMVVQIAPCTGLVTSCLHETLKILNDLPTYRHLLTGQHSTLKAKTLTKVMCTKEWLQEGLMIQN